MMAFSFTHKNPLASRRLAHTTRRVLGALCAGLAVLLTLGGAVALVAKTPVVVASRAITRGSVVTVNDVTTTRIASLNVSGMMMESLDDVVGKIAQIDIESGEPFTSHMARDAPVTPDGFTTIDVPLASSGFVAGDRVRLLTSMGCDSSLCTLADPAIVMDLPNEDTHLTTLAMSPQDALAVMKAQDVASIVAVVTTKH